MAGLEVARAVAGLVEALAAVVVVSAAAARRGDGKHAFKTIIQACIHDSAAVKSGVSKGRIT
jgi:hypothetical protein